MKKYWLIFIQSFSQYTTYRLQIIYQIIQSSLPAIVTLIALSFARSSGINSQSLISYYLLVTITSPLTFSSIDEYIEEITFSGEVNNFLTKPISFFRMLMVKQFSEKAITFIMLLPVFLAILLILKTNFVNLIWFPLTILLSFLISYTFSFIIGLGCFWLDEFWSIRNVKFVAIQLLGGLILPYSVFPDWLLKIIYFTPFPYLSSWPGRTLQSGITIYQISQAVAWLIILLIIQRLVQNRAIRHYSHTGN